MVEWICVEANPLVNLHSRPGRVDRFFRWTFVKPFVTSTDQLIRRFAKHAIPRHANYSDLLTTVH